MAKLKVEFLNLYYGDGPRPLGHLLLGRIFQLNGIGSALAPMANAALRNRVFKWLLEKTSGIDRRRTLPTFVYNHFRKWFREHPIDPRSGRRGPVVLIDDCFTTYNNPEVGIAAVRVLEASGYRVILAGLRCCGRPAISKGLLRLGRDLARQNLEKLSPLARQGIPILGCEPSCLVTLVDEYRDFRLGPAADLVARQCSLVEAFLADPARAPDLALQPLKGQVLVHGHCQQKATFGMAGTLAALKRIPGLQVQELDSGCCGMAGSFGYELGHYDVSTALANRVLLPAAAANPDARLVAPGFSCRSQVHGLAGIHAVHPVQVLEQQLASG
jgi:Fe-S oxidoreductase